MKKIVLSAVVSILTLGLWSCGEKEEAWTVKGTIKGGSGKTLVLETSGNGRWYPVDTFNLIDAGGFYMKHPLKDYPDIYRLTLDGKKIYFPYLADETVIVKADAAHFDRGYRLSGSEQAVAIMRIDSIINHYVDSLGVDAVINNYELKRDFVQQAINDSSTMVIGNYLIMRYVGDFPLLDPRDKGDFRLIRGICNTALTYLPNDPRTKFLELYYNEFREKRPSLPASSPADTLYLSETGLPHNITLYDAAGKKHSLKDYASNGNVIILSFVSYGANVAPAYNLALREVYDEFKDAGLQIFQISTDKSQFDWEVNSRNLPWVSVFNTGSEATSNLTWYNVNTNSPTTFIITRQGELSSERVDDINTLRTVLQKYL